MSEQKRIHVVVKGIVQGVFYRSSAQEKAQALNITGWVRNLQNGDVEMEAQGTQEQLDSLLLWAQSGPSPARVDSVSCNPCDAKHDEQDFLVLR